MREHRTTVGTLNRSYFKPISMKTQYLAGFLALMLPIALHAQQSEWLHGWPVDYNLNPALPQHVIAASPNGTLMAACLEAPSQAIGMDLSGSVAVHRLDPDNGDPLWSFNLAPEVAVECGAADDDGNIYVAGKFLGDLELSNNTILAHVASSGEGNLFLLKFGPTGLLLWQRNLSIDHPSATSVAAFAIDPDGDLWYAINDFNTAWIEHVDSNGAATESRTITAVRTLGGMSFGPAGGLYVSGSMDGNDELSFGGLTVQLPPNEAYLMYLLRFRPDGTGHWAQFAPDITFQSPVVKADPFGNAYIAGTILDATSWGAIDFNGADWVYGTFLAKADSTGAFLWGVESDPAGGTITGDLAAGKLGCLAVDGAGNPYLTGTARGLVDWGNGVVSGNEGTSTRSQTIVAFSPDGLPLWAANSATADFVTALGMASMGDGTLFFSNSVSGPFSFPPLQVGDSTVQSFVVGRIGGTSTGIVRNPMHNKLRAFPSPFNEGFRIMPRPSANAEVTAMDANGRVVYRGSYFNGLGHDWASGRYVVECRDGKERSVLHVVKE